MDPCRSVGGWTGDDPGGIVRTRGRTWVSAQSFHPRHSSKSAPNWNDFNVSPSRPTARKSIAYNCREGNTVSMCDERSTCSQRASCLRRPRSTMTGFSLRMVSGWQSSMRSDCRRSPSVAGSRRCSIVGPIMSCAEGIQLGTRRLHFIWHIVSGIQRVASIGRRGGSGDADRTERRCEVPLVALPLLPDGRSALITIVRADGSGTAGLLDLKDRIRSRSGIRGDGFTLRWSPGWLIFQQRSDSVCYSRSIPPIRLALLTRFPFSRTSSTFPSVARDGTVVYVPHPR